MKHVGSAALLVGILVSSAPVAAKKEKAPKSPPPACGFKSIPLALGNVWTYKSGSGTVLIRVADVTEGKGADGDEVEIKVEEKYQDRATEVVFTCSEKKGLVIPPGSFFFAGEPGGAVAAEVKVTKHDSVSLVPDKEIKSGAGWVDKVYGEVVRADVSGQGAQHKPAKFEVERHVTVASSEVVELKMGRATAQRIDFELRGRGVVENEKSEIPIKRPGAIFLLKGLGILKIDDAFDRTWELVSTNVPFKKK